MRTCLVRGVMGEDINGEGLNQVSKDILEKNCENNNWEV